LPAFRTNIFCARPATWWYVKVSLLMMEVYIIAEFSRQGVARALDNMTLAIKDRYVFCMAPVDTKNPTVLFYLILVSVIYRL